MRKWSMYFLAALILTQCGRKPAAGDFLNESSKAKNERMAWWRGAKFGMFIHWGVYSVPAGEYRGRTVDGASEWIMNSAPIPVVEYEGYTGRFNPVKFDADAWAKLAADAGMKYLVITSKHHDGFCLWDSKLTDYTAAKSPFKRDILKELHEACRAEGVKLCFYHSIMDWHHPDYLPRRPWDPRPGVEAKFDRYVEHLKGQLKELVEAFDPPILWFDGEWEGTWTHEHGKMLYDYCRSLKPDVIVNNRVDKGRQGMQGLTKEGEFRGDYGTPEQEIPATGLPGVDWETCMTMNDTWGFKKDDRNWKSAEDLIRKLVDIASKGGNFLLNVGPTAEGLIPEPSVERLEKVGKWMALNGEAIHGTSASPFKALPWGRATRRPGKLYLHVFDWPKDGKLVVPGIAGKVAKAYLLAEKGKALDVEAGAGKVTVTVPAAAPDKVASVVVLEVEGE
jgi:alpha-L-fucosidase